MRRVLKWIGILFAILAALALAAVLFVALFDWNQARGPISSFVSDALGRRFAINGNLELDLSRTPRLTVEDVQLANTPWGSAPEMFTLKRFELNLDLMELLKGRLVIPEVVVSGPRLLLERNAAGENNWALGAAGPPGGGITIPEIGRVRIENGTLTYRDTKAAAEFTANLADLSGAVAAQAVKLEGSGKLQEKPFTLALEGGALPGLRDAEKPYPVDTTLTFGRIRTTISGTLLDAARLRGVDLDFDSEGPGLSDLYPLIGMPLAETPPFRFRGKIRLKSGRWIIEPFAGTLGNSDLSGAMGFSLRDGRPFLTGDLFSRKLDFKDFGGFIGAEPVPLAQKKRILPDKELQPKTLRLADLEIDFRSNNIVTPFVPVDELKTRLRLEQGVLTIDPVVFAIEIGRINATVILDARKETFFTSIKADIRKVPFKRLVSKTPFADETSGTFFGRVNLATDGRSVAQMAGAADGDVMILMEQGRISNLLMELSGIDLAESLGILVRGDPSIPVRCIIADYGVIKGVMKTQLVLLDTTDTNVLMEGEINLGMETVDLKITAQPKDPSLFSARTPIHIEGPIKRLKVYPDPVPLLAKGAASLALGALLTPAAAIIPWIELGLGEDSPCHALVSAAKRQGGNEAGASRRRTRKSGR